MSINKTTPIGFASGRQRLVRYTIAIVNAVTLIGTILLVTWILGKIISALHALVFSLAFAESPNQLQENFPRLEDSLTPVKTHSFIPQTPEKSDSSPFYSIDSSDWDR